MKTNNFRSPLFYMGDKFKLLDQMYVKQKVWAVGSDINKINDLLKKIGAELKLKKEDMDKCLKDEKNQDNILNQRIDAQRKYKIESTPTVFINEKKYTGKINYKDFRKILDKKL